MRIFSTVVFAVLTLAVQAQAVNLIGERRDWEYQTIELPGAGSLQVNLANGQFFTEDSIGSALAGRMVGEHLRSMGVATSGPPPFGPKDRSSFLQALDQAVVRAKRALALQSAGAVTR